MKPASTEQAETAKRQRELQALQAAGVAITSNPDLQFVLDTITREMTNLLEMKACALSQWSQESRAAQVQAKYGPEDWWGERLPVTAYRPTDFASTERVLWERQALQLRCDQRDIEPEEQAYMQAAGIEFLVKLPMVFQERVVGLVEVMDDRPGYTLPGERVELAQLLANQAASAIENTRIYDAFRRHIAEVATLSEISQVITSILDLHDTLAIIADDAHWLLDVAAASVVLYDRERDELWFGASSGEGAEFVQNRRLKAGKGIAFWVIRHGVPLIVPDVSKEPRFFGDWDREMGFTTKSILCVPLRARGQTIGAIEAINKASGPFDHEDLTLLTSMAAWAAIAVENARLYEQAQQEITERKRVAAELRRVNQALEEIVTERTRELQAERDRTQNILEAVGEAVIVTDLQGQIQYLNPAALELTGYTVEEAEGRSSGLWQQDAPPAKPALQEQADLEAAQARSVEVVSRRKDGTLYDAMMTVAPLFDPAGNQAIGYVSVQRDITPIKEAERLKDQFVSNVSHELRTPLSVLALVSGNLEMLYDRLPDEKRREMVRGIREHAQVLDNLVSDILAISRIESGHISMERQDVNLAQVAREEVEKQSPLAQKKAQILRATGDKHLVVHGNEDQLRLAIRNLVNNAIKYTPEGGHITCECAMLAGSAIDETWPGSGSLAPAGRWAALRVSDTGIGISQEDLPRVFERFYRVKTESNIAGTGLGLSIAQELAESHGGHIAAASTLGKGSVFATYLPLQEE